MYSMLDHLPSIWGHRGGEEKKKEVAEMEFTDQFPRHLTQNNQTALFSEFPVISGPTRFHLFCDRLVDACLLHPHQVLWEDRPMGSLVLSLPRITLVLQQLRTSGSSSLKSDSEGLRFLPRGAPSLRVPSRPFPRCERALPTSAGKPHICDDRRSRPCARAGSPSAPGTSPGAGSAPHQSGLGGG